MRGLCCPGESLRRAADEVPQCGRWNANSISPRRDHQFLQWSQVSGPPPVVGQGVDRAWHLLPLTANSRERVVARARDRLATLAQAIRSKNPTALNSIQSIGRT